MKWGLEILGFAIVVADAGTGVHLVAKQTFTDKVKGAVPYYPRHMYNQNTIIGIYLRTIHSLKDDLLKLSSCLVADAFFSKETFVTGAKALDFAFNMSLSTINVARQFGKEYDVDLSISDVKELLFYGFRAAV